MLASLAITCCTWLAISRSTNGSLPITRKLTGHGTGGPNNNRLTRTRAALNSPAVICSDNRCMIRSRPSASLATISIFANDGSGCSGFAEMKNRGAPAPIKLDKDFTSSLPCSSCSTCSAVALVLAIAVPCGIKILTNTSGRSELGKNCFCTNLPIPRTAKTKATTVMPITAFLCLIHQRIKARSLR